MKVALETGEVLDVALVEGDRIIGTLSLQLKGLAGSTPRVGRPAGSTTANAAAAPRKQRKQRKPMSAEARARMSAAQKERWSNRKGGNEGGNQGGSENQ